MHAYCMPAGSPTPLRQRVCPSASLNDAPASPGWCCQTHGAGGAGGGCCTSLLPHAPHWGCCRGACRRARHTHARRHRGASRRHRCCSCGRGSGGGGQRRSGVGCGGACRCALPLLLVPAAGWAGRYSLCRSSKSGLPQVTAGDVPTPLLPLLPSSHFSCSCTTAPPMAAPIRSSAIFPLTSAQGREGVEGSHLLHREALLTGWVSAASKLHPLLLSYTLAPPNTPAAST